ncbi:MAG: DUF5309 family protein [Methanogenium sp.]|jgi:hypothetical protein
MPNTFPYASEPTHQQGAANTAGQRSTDTYSSESRLVVDAKDYLAMLAPRRNPLMTLFTNVGKTWDGRNWSGASTRKSPCTQYKFEVFEDQLGARYARVSAAYASQDSSTAVYVTGAGTNSGYVYTVDDIVYNIRTGEKLRVTAVSTDNITVDRQYGSTAFAAGAAGDELLIIGTVSEEGSTARNSNSTLIENAYNYTQIFKDSVTLTNSAKATKTYAGNDMKLQRNKVGTKHAYDIEHSMWFGERKTTTGTNGKRMSLTGGIHEHLNAGNSFVQSQGGLLTAPDFNVFVRESYYYGNDTKSKTLFAGSYIISAVNEIALGQIQTKPMETSFGMKVTEWVTPFGAINIVHNPLFVGDLAGRGYLLNLDNYGYRYLEGNGESRDTKLTMNVQAPDADGEIDQYLTECGLDRQLAAESSMLLDVVA